MEDYKNDGLQKGIEAQAIIDFHGTTNHNQRSDDNN
jgi:hypothetical protein